MLCRQNNGLTLSMCLCVSIQLVINDCLQTIMHLAEHKVSPAIYKVRAHSIGSHRVTYRCRTQICCVLARVAQQDASARLDLPFLIIFVLSSIPVCTTSPRHHQFLQSSLCRGDVMCYQSSHKPHHRFLNPKMFDAFNGSLTDTVCMILFPLSVTAQLV